MMWCSSDMFVCFQNFVEYWSMNEAGCGPFVISQEQESKEDMYTTRDITLKVNVRKIKQNIYFTCLTFYNSKLRYRWFFSKQAPICVSFWLTFLPLVCQMSPPCWQFTSVPADGTTVMMGAVSFTAGENFT